MRVYARVYIIMLAKGNIGRTTVRGLRQAVLQGCGVGCLLLLFLFLCSQNALGNQNNQSVASLSSSPAPEGIDMSFYDRYPYLIVIGEGGSADISEDYFFRNAATVVFKVAKYALPYGDPTLRELTQVVLPQMKRDDMQIVRVMMRGAASPEGTEALNRVLSEKRQKALYDYVKNYLKIPQSDSLRLESATEDYSFLCRQMQQAGDPDAERVSQLFDEHMPRGQYAELKKVLQTIDGGRLWRRMLNTYFPSLRAARMVIVCKKRKPKPVVSKSPVSPIGSLAQIEPLVPQAADMPALVIPGLSLTPAPLEMAETPEPETGILRYPRREMLSIKTNLLFYGVYMPGYNRWCPIPNVAVEYYPLRGHFTFGASFDCPWWQNYWGHKYFQVRNYQLEARYYFRRGDIELRPEGKGAAFKGWYLQAYGNVGLFGICFDERRGWVGEGGGGGIGVGYVMPLSKKGHWRLEFQLQAGVFVCKYDPYQYENPVDPNYRDHLYYYDWTQSPSLFKTRQYRFTWFGPTRIGVTLSYDLLYRKARKKTDGWRCEKDTEPTRRYNPLVPYEKGGRQ